MVTRCVLGVLIVGSAFASTARAEARTEQAEAGAASVPNPPRTWQGVAVAYENGAFGRGFGQVLRLKIPLHEHWGTKIRALSVARHGRESTSGQRWPAAATAKPFSLPVTAERLRRSAPARAGHQNTTNVMIAKIGKRMAVDQSMYPKNPGMRTRFCSAMAFTMKLGPLPM